MTHRQSMVHEDWALTMETMARASSDPRASDVAAFCANVLRLCGDTPELTEFLNARALKAMEAQDSK